jgi:ApeA N-terminal domain 1
MQPSNAQKSLEAGESLTGKFCPAGANFETAGLLTWSADRGAELRLADLSHPWPTDFDNQLTIHGQLHAGGPVTLLLARLSERTFINHASRYSSAIVALGEHTDMDETWTYANYCPTSLHEWYPKTGFVHSHSEDGRPRIEMQPVEPLSMALPSAEVTIHIDGDWTASYSANWSIETTMKFSVQPEEPLTIEDHWAQYGNPLLGFIIFASDRPDDLRWESFYNPQTKRQIVLLRSDRKSFEREWRPQAGHFLFRAEDIGDVGEALRRWLAAWRPSEPSLGLFCETIQQDSTYSPPRFLTLYTAAEGYWKGTRRSCEKIWGIDALEKRAGIDPAVSKADKKARKLIGALRRYHAHLALPGSLSAEDLAFSTYDSTRRLHALMQACLLREIGMETSQIESLIAKRYLPWPIPQR